MRPTSRGTHHSLGAAQGSSHAKCLLQWPDEPMHARECLGVHFVELALLPQHLSQPSTPPHTLGQPQMSKT